MEKPTYYIRFEDDFDSVIPAWKAKVELEKTIKEPLEIGCYMPQPLYKSWVPYWFIYLITKH
jgi:hypothetical protein